jgi:hypothetical protein
MTPPDKDNGRREAARYLRDLADRLVDYPTDHYKEAAEALRAYADETEAVALGAASPVRLEEPAIRALAKYGRHLDDCTRQNMRGRCSCGFSRCFDENALGSALPVPATGPQDDGGTSRSCTCHPDDHPPVPCAEKYAYSECVAAAARRPVPATGPSLRALIDQWRSDASECYEDEASNAFRHCADQLEAALAAGSAPSVITNHEDQKT